MLSTFISCQEEWHIADYPGRVIRCRFAPTHYHDELFFAAGLYFPPALSDASPKRKAEFLAGRYLVKHLLDALGIGNFTLLNSEGRAPRWPAGIAGSISHNVDTVLCAVHVNNGHHGVGLDVETLLTDESAVSLWPAIVNPREYAWLERQPAALSVLLTLTFSAKESLFKALYPQSGRYFDFLDACMVSVDLTAQRFELALTTALNAAYPAGRRFSGRFVINDNNLTTFIYSAPDLPGSRAQRK